MMQLQQVDPITLIHQLLSTPIPCHSNEEIEQNKRLFKIINYLFELNLVYFSTWYVIILLLEELEQNSIFKSLFFSHQEFC